MIMMIIKKITTTSTMAMLMMRSYLVYLKCDIHGGSMKSKPNGLSYIYLLPDHSIIKLPRYLDNSTKNVIPAHRHTLFNS